MKEKIYTPFFAFMLLLNIVYYLINNLTYVYPPRLFVYIFHAIFNFSILTYYYYHYKFWTVLKDDQTSPKKMTLLLFVPGFNIYWIFKSFCGLAEKYSEKDPEFPANTKTLAKHYCMFWILWVVPDLLIAYPYKWLGLNNVITWESPIFGWLGVLMIRNVFNMAVMVLWVIMTIRFRKSYIRLAGKSIEKS